jgi:hypothetical protein
MKKQTLWLLFQLMLIPGIASAFTERESGKGLSSLSFQKADTSANAAAVPVPPPAIVPIFVGGMTADSISQVQRFDASGNTMTYVSNPTAGVAFYASMAMQSKLRENSIIANVANGVGCDSTGVIPTNGAKRIGVYVYAIADSMRNTADSTMTLVMAMLPKAHLIALADSGAAAIWNPLVNTSAGTDTTGPRLGTDPMTWAPLRITNATTVRTDGAIGIAGGGLAPGELIYLYTRGDWEAFKGDMRPPWAYTEFCTAATGCFAPAYFSLRTRILGEVIGASGLQQMRNFSNTFARYTQTRFIVRIDVIGYYN